MHEINAFLVGLYLVLNIADVITTNLAIDNNPSAYEANPIMLWCMDKMPERWWLPKMVLSVVLSVLFFFAASIWSLACLVCLDSFLLYIVLHNYRIARNAK